MDAKEAREIALGNLNRRKQAAFAVACNLLPKVMEEFNAKLAFAVASGDLELRLSSGELVDRSVASQSDKKLVERALETAVRNTLEPRGYGFGRYMANGYNGIIITWAELTDIQ